MTTNQTDMSIPTFLATLLLAGPKTFVNVPLNENRKQHST